MRFTRFIFLLSALSLGQLAYSQPATPPVPHNEAVGTHDVSSDSVGATPGDFRVDEGGAASYSLPIMSLPGTAGLSPKLSLDYSARGSVGALGTGFMLSGQSAFTRCKKTVEAGDGAGPHPGADFADTAGGAFCLDGQRVFTVTDANCPNLSGIPSSGRPFRTELDPATRICGYSTVSNTAEIDFWLVFPKDGTMRRYGYAGSSSLRPNDGLIGTARAFGYQVQALDRIADATGNTVDFSYSGTVTTGELLLLEARYTGKVANRLNMAASYTRQPFARTAMVYAALDTDAQREDFYAGSQSVLTQRLSEINVYGPANNGATPGAEVHARSYRLNYAQATSGSRMPRLVAVQECAPALGAVAETCYPPTRFAWNSEFDNDFPQGYLAPPTSRSYSNLINFAVDFKVGDINGDGRQDLVYIKDRNCPGNPAGERDSNAASQFRFRYMVALGDDTGLQASTNADVFPRRSPSTSNPIPSCQDAGPATNFDTNQPIRWDLIWYLFDLTGDGRDDLIAQVPDFGTCSTCYRWKVFAAELIATRWSFSGTGTDLGIASNSDQDANLTDITGDGLPDLVFGNPSNSTLAVRAMQRVTGNANQAFAFETTDRTVTFDGFEPDAFLSFGTSQKEALRSGDLTGDGIADLILHASKIRSGIQCNGGTCGPCGGQNQPVCQPDLIQACPPNATSCIVPRPDRLNLGPQPRWQNASQTQAAGANRLTTDQADYWVTAKVIPNGNNFVISAGQCLGPGANPAFCNDTGISLLSASLTDINGDGLADVFMRYRQSGSGSSQIDRFAYRLNRGGNDISDSLNPEQSTGLSLKVREADRLQLADTNGDKRMDLVYQTTCSFTCPSGVNPLKMRRFLRTGFAFEEDAATGSPAVLGNQNPDRYLVLPLDINGDGAADLVRYKADNSTTQNMYVVLANLRYGGNDFIVKFTNGFNVEHKVSYAPLVSKFTYERAFDGPRANYGRNSAVFDVFTPLWAVREARSSSPGCAPDALTCTTNATTLSATSIVRYSYRGARLQTGGRGFLGFASIRTEDIQNKLLTTTDYSQNYPFIGRPVLTTVQVLPAVIADPCLVNPLLPQCFEEPPPNCGPVICPIAESRTPMREDEAGSLQRISSAPAARFGATLPTITESTNQYTSLPVFAAATQQAIVVYSNTSSEKRFDLITQAQTQRIATIMVMDAQANLSVQESTTFDANDLEVERKGQLNFYGCTETPVVLVKGTGCQSTPTPNLERVRLGRLSLTSVYTVRAGVVKERRSSYEYDPTTLLLNAEVQGLYNYGNPGEPPLSAKASMHSRTDHVLDTNGNRTLSVTCDVSTYPNRAACTNLTQFQQQQWPATPTRFQRYTRMEYDTLGRFMQGSRSPYFSAGITAGVEAYNERSGVDATGTVLNRNVYGDPLGALTAHGVFAEKAYGPIGREYFAKAAPGAFSRNTYAWCTDATSTTLPDGSGGIPSSAPRVNCPVGALYRVESNTSEGNNNTQFIAPRTFAYFDKLGRNILSTSRLYQSSEADPTNVSRWTSSFTRYDLLGRVKSKSEPYLSKDPLAAQSTHRAGDTQSGITPAETRTNYDALGRSASVELPAESYNGLTVSSAEFDRMQTKSFNPRSNAMTMDKNGLAESTFATDANSFQVAYRYEPQGNMDQVTRTPNDGSSAFQTITTSLEYDVLGRKSSMIDPDKGTISYTYNALGELLTQTDAKGQTQTLFYDALGRLIERRENRKLASGSFQNEPTAKWIYDDALLVGTSQKAVGLLISESNGLAGTGQFARGYSYDSFGRSVAAATNLEGTLYYQRTTYDQYGRVFQSFDVSTNASSPAGQLQLYSSDGYPIGVREAANGLIGQIYSEVLALSERQQVRRERYHGTNNFVSNRTFEQNTGRLATIVTSGSSGNNLQNWSYRWDKNGSLSERSDTTNGADWKEEFVYDTLDRLTSVKQVRTNGLATPTSVSLALAYDQLGNITSKTGFANANLGSYQYKTFEVGCANQAGPHAASQVNGKSYCYDLNGNNTEVRKNGSVIRTIVYTGFDLAESISRNEQTAEGLIQAQVSFQYGTDRAMFKRVDGAASSGNDQIFKTGFEDNEPPTPVGGGSKVTYYVGNVEFIREGISSSTKRYIGNYLVITNVGNNPATFDYLLRDSLGSIDTIASETGALKSRQSFNAHGQRRQAAQSGVTSSWSTLILPRFRGHLAKY